MEEKKGRKGFVPHPLFIAMVPKLGPSDAHELQFSSNPASKATAGLWKHILTPLAGGGGGGENPQRIGIKCHAS